MDKFIIALVSLLFQLPGIANSSDFTLLQGELPARASITGVPFIKQKPYLCAPASAEMVLKHSGIPRLNQELISTSDANNKTGTHWIKMAAYLNKHGLTLNFRTKIVLGNMGLLKRYIASGYPVMVRQWKNSKKKTRHYRVAVGYDDLKRVITYHDPAKRPNMKMGYGRFTKLWNIKTKRARWSSKNLMIVMEKTPNGN